MTPPTRVLLIEDDTSAASALRCVLADEGYNVTVVTRGDEGLTQAQAELYHVVVTDLRLPGLNGLQLVKQLHQARPKLPIILMTAHGTTETAIEATKLGAFDYLLKPFEMPELLELVSKAANASHLMMERIEMGEATTLREAIIGNSRVMQNIYKEIGRIATNSVTVLIRGETGTGKELVARSIYQHSERSQQPFIAINCAAIPETLLESELFGHERGAFTGADSRRIGRFEQADHGTIFLDEIGDTSLNIQAKLLRVLQDRCIQRLGGKEIIPVDVRVIAATHCDLEAAMTDGLFREDLFYRLNVVNVTLPPLRQRHEDIPGLVNYFLRRYSKDFGFDPPMVQPEVFPFLQEYAWPGNVRELENVVRQALVLTRGYPIHLEHLRHVLARSANRAGVSGKSLPEVIAEHLSLAKQGNAEAVYYRLIEDVEREIFTQAIRLAEGNQAKTARWLGISRLTLREKLNHFELHPAASKEDNANEQ